jgi:hypothetical protein
VCCTLLLSLVSTPQAAFAQGSGWFDVNFGTATMAADGESRSMDAPLFGQTATLGIDYDFPLGAHFDVGGGYMFTPMFGVGAAFTGDASEGYPTLRIRIPHPFFFNAHAEDETEGDLATMRSEGGINIQFVVNLTPRSDRWALRVYGGPTYYRVTQDVVTDINYTHSFSPFTPTQTVNITSYEIEEAEGTGWGAHGGADIGYFFTNVVGIGGGFRFGVGNVDLEDLIGEYSSDTGAMSFYGGLRLRFGR